MTKEEIKKRFLIVANLMQPFEDYETEHYTKLTTTDLEEWADGISEDYNIKYLKDRMIAANELYKQLK